jgi:hypothetical protein
MGQVWSAIDSMIGPEVDERDLRLAARMVREHHKHTVNAIEEGTPVPWSQTSHINPIFVLNPVRTEWDYIEQMFENAPLPTYQALYEAGIFAMLQDIQNFQSDPNSLYPFGTHYLHRCAVCDEIAHDEGDVDLWDGPIGTERFFASWGERFQGRWVWNDPNGRNTGVGRNRRMEAQ